MMPPQDNVPGLTGASPPKTPGLGPGRIALVVLAAVMSLLMCAGIGVGALVLPLSNAYGIFTPGEPSPSPSKPPRCGQKIAVTAPLSGPVRWLGEAIRNGAKLAIDDYNANHRDCQVQLVSVDTPPDERYRPDALDVLLDDTMVIGAVGPVLARAEKITTVLAAAKLPSITPSVTKPGTTDGSLRFRALGNDDAEAEALVRYLRDVVRAQKVYILVDTEAPDLVRMMETVRKGLREKIAGTRTYRREQAFIVNAVPTMKASGVDAVLLLGYAPDTGAIVRQLRVGGVTAPVVGTSAMLIDGYTQTAGQHAEGTTVTCPCVPPEKAGGNFAAKYEKAFGKRPEYYVAESYDVAKIFLAGLAAGVRTRDDMSQFIAKYDSDGVTKHFRFTDDGELDPKIVPIWTYQVRAGRFVPGAEVPR